MSPPAIEGPALFEETQRFPVWVYALIAVVLLVLFALFSMRQVTRVDAGGVTVRFGLIYRTSVRAADIRVAEAVQYRPVRDYGGWGVKGRSARRAVNTRGDLGVLLTRNDGSTLLIGSQKPRDLLAALGRAGVRTEDRLPPVVRDF